MTALTAPAKASLWEVFATVPDPRDPSGRRFPLQGMLGILVAALLAGRQGLAAVARWGRECSGAQLERLGIHRRRAPCHATWHNVFKAVDCGAVERALAAWTRGALPHGAVLAMDGKSLRGSRYAEYPAVHLLAAYCDAISGVLGQRRVDSSRASELTEVAALLEAVPAGGRVVTGDAMFAQRKVCEAILERGGDYVFTVKGNQSGVREAIEQALAPADTPAGEKKAGGHRDRGGRNGKKAWARGGKAPGGHGLA